MGEAGGDPLAGSLLRNAVFLNGGLPLRAIDPSTRPAEWKNYTAQYSHPFPPWPDGLESPVVEGVALFVEEVDGGQSRAVQEGRKRFILFAYDDYYPCGGSGDLRGEFDSLEEAQAEGESLRNDSKEILDLDTGMWMNLDGEKWGQWT